MKYVLGLLLLIASAMPLTAQEDKGSSKPQGDTPAVKFPRGGKRTPANKIAQAAAAGHIQVHSVARATPAQVAMVPPRLSMWGNSQYGDCVSAEAAWAIAAYSVYAGQPEIFVTEATVIAWAKTHGFLNGADLLEVSQAMQKYGMKDENGVLRKMGSPSTVDYSNEAVLQNAISMGPVQIAIDADALPSGAGNKSGWIAFGGGNFPNTDHCVGLGGYGPIDYLYKALGLTPPSKTKLDRYDHEAYRKQLFVTFSRPEDVLLGAPTSGYLLFTWNTIGIVDHKWLMGTCVEAWLRTPTIVGLAPPPPPNPPQPPNPPNPPPSGQGKIIIQIPGQPDQIVPFALPAAASGGGTYKVNADGTITLTPVAPSAPPAADKPVPSPTKPISTDQKCGPDVNPNQAARIEYWKSIVASIDSGELSETQVNAIKQLKKLKYENQLPAPVGK